MNDQRWVYAGSLTAMTLAGFLCLSQAWGGAPRPAASRKWVSGAAAQALAPQGPLAALGRAVTAQRYRVEPAPRQPGAFVAANPAQSLAVRFQPREVELAAGSHRPVRFRTVALGRGAGLRPVAPGRVRANGDRVEYTHRTAEGATLKEWWANTPQGVEQGWTVSRKPAGGRTKNTAPLTLAFSVAGPLTPEVAADGRSVTLKEASGAPVLHGAGLKAWDAAGRSLSIRLTSGSSQHSPTSTSPRLTLAVNDAGAQYPVTIDPVWTQDQRLTQAAGDASVNALLGWAVALDGDTALVGAEGDSPVVGGSPVSGAGSAYVFTRSGATWSLQQKLTADDAGINDAFGTSVALYGDTAVVGASLKGRSVSGTPYGYVGAAYVFTRSGATWTQQQKLQQLDAEVAERNLFGAAVAVNNDWIFVGAEGTLATIGGVPAVASGTVYVYGRSSGSWVRQQVLTEPAGDTPGFDLFGCALPLDGDTLVVGAYLDTPIVNGSPVPQAGAAYVFVQSGGSWSLQQKLFDANTTESFGYSVDIDGDTVVVGAPVDTFDVGGGTLMRAGAAHVFVRSGGTWSQQAKLTKPLAEARTNDLFGWSVAVDGDTLAVGAKWEHQGALINAGAIYLFNRSGSAWTQSQRLIQAPGSANVVKQLGNALALEGDTLLGGAYATSPEIGGSPVAFAGAVVVFRPKPFTLTAPATATVGQALTVQWNVPPGQSVKDWIGFYRSDVPGSAGYLNWIYTKGAATGSFTITAPGPGAYVFRYYLNDGSSLQAVSQTVNVSDPPASEFSLSISTDSVAPGGSYTVSWSAPAGRPVKDWIGIFPKATPGSTGYGQWLYTGGARTGSKLLPAPSAPGDYEARMFLQDSNLLAATSGTLTVTAPPAPTVTPAVTTIATGGTLKVSWTAPPGRPAKDWVTLVKTSQLNSGSPQTVSGYVKWAYTGGTTAGSTNFSLAGIAPGTYYCVYLLNDTTTVGAVSGTVTVTP